jgi:sec-independent protein translocase protein TatA
MNSTLLFLGGVGMQELLFIGLFVLIFFGAKKIPDFMKGLGKGIREFKNGVKDVKMNIEDSELEEQPEKDKTEKIH